MTIDKKLIIMFVLIIIFVYVFYLYFNNAYYEYLTNSSLLSNEAIQNIANVYNTTNMSVGNITTTGQITTPTLSTSSVIGPNSLTTVNNNLTVKGDTTSNNFLTASTNGMMGGTGDGNSYGTYNVGIKSWWGVGFPTTCTNGCGAVGTKGAGGMNAIVFDTRSGTGNFMGNLNIGGSITSRTSPQMFGAVMIDGGHDVHPIPSSLSSYNGNYPAGNDIDDSYIVYPGYKIIVYKDGGYSGSSVTFDNTNGTVPVFYNLSGTSVGNNNGSSCRLYYLGREVTITGLS